MPESEKHVSVSETNLAQTHKWCTFQLNIRYKIIGMFHTATISAPMRGGQVCCALMLRCLCTANQPVTPAGAPGHHAPLRMPMCCQKWETEQAHVKTKTVRQKHLTHIHHQKSRPESAFFKYPFVFNVFTSFNLLCKSEVLQAFQRPWPLKFFFF